MQFLTFSEYSELGGMIVNESVFSILEHRAERKLNYFTQDRLKTTTTIISEVKELMVEFVDRMASVGNNMAGVTSYSNGIESFGFSEEKSKALDKELHSLAIEYLPIELISAYVESASEVY